MKRATTFLFLAITAFPLVAATDDMTALKAYATKSLPRCADSQVTIEPIDGPGPAGFMSFGVTMTSTDPTCGRRSRLLYSPATQQVLIGTVVPLALDGRNVEARVSQKTSEILKQDMTASLTRGFPLPDGLKPISITRSTAFGPFSYHGYVDATERFLVVGTRGNLKIDPAKTLVDSIGLERAVRRGNPKAKVKIIELSDFQCPTCGRAHKVMEPLIKKNLSNIDYYRMDLPLFEHHEWVVPATLGARAIQKVAPKKYWAYVDFIFENQETIGKMGSFDKTLQNFVEDNDISWSAVEKIYRSVAERDAIMEQTSRLFDLGLMSTPTYIINGQIMGYGPDGKFTIESVKKAIRK